MSCGDDSCALPSAKANLNKLIKAQNETHLVTMEYGNYMNWGRWQNNTHRVEQIVQLLNQRGVSVQLAFFENDGNFVRVIYNGQVIAKDNNLQHNSNYYSLEKLSKELVDAVMAALAKK